jgi:hypothetical protein
LTYELKVVVLLQYEGYPAIEAGNAPSGLLIDLITAVKAAVYCSTLGHGASSGDKDRCTKGMSFANLDSWP